MVQKVILSSRNHRVNEHRPITHDGGPDVRGGRRGAARGPRP